MKKNNGAPSPIDAAARASSGPPAAFAAGGPPAEWAAMPERRAAPRASAGPDFQEEVKRVLLARYTPAAILVDDALNVVYVHGDVSPFVEFPAGASAVNFVKTMRGDVALTIRAALLKAKSEDRTVSKIVRRPMESRQAGLAIDVVAIRSRSDRRRAYLVLFKTDGPANPAEENAPAGQLEFEGRRRKGDSRSAGNSAAKSFGDVNDELIAAKEELQAANAELRAVNLELRKGNSNLNATNDDLSNLLASSQIPILMLDRRMCIRRCTPPAERAFGLTSSNVGQSIAGLKLNIEAPLLKDAVRDVIAGFEAKQLEVRDRHERWYSVWIRPYRTTANVIDGAVLSMDDITEKRNGIRALEASRDFAEAIVDTVNDPVLILNRHLKVKSASRIYCEMFQESSLEVEGRSIYELGSGRWNVPNLRKQLSMLAAQGTPLTGWETDFDVPRLGRRTLSISGRVVPQEAESERKIVIAIEDVSLRKHAAEAAALRKSEARQREFVANVSHELMTPIAAIKGYSESLSAGALEIPAKRVEFTQIIERNADRLAGLVEDLLQLSSYDAGRVRSAPEPVPLRASIEKLLTSVAPVARGKGVTIRVLVPEALRVTMNRAELTQVLQNLCENAVKYNRDKGRVWIRARRIGGKVLVSVQDTGIGVPKEDLPRIFDRFHRAENARLKTARGNGLGLSIVRSILARRGCRIRAESVVGKGTIISFTLPRAEKPRR